jgi:hypothetical protein
VTNWRQSFDDGVGLAEVTKSIAGAKLLVMVRHRRFRAGGLGSLLVLSSLLAVRVSPLASTTPASGEIQGSAGSSGSGWRITSSPDRGTFDELDGVTVTSSTQAWAVGRYIDAAGQSRALIERAEDGAWKIAFTSGTSTRDSYLLAISADTSSDIWAVGYTDSLNYEKSRTLIEHWDRHRWTISASAVPGALFGVSALSQRDVWAVGVNTPKGGAPQTLVEHWNGTKWSIVKSAGPGSYGNSLSAVFAVSSTDIWAVGQSEPSEYGFKDLVLHWDGTKWSAVSSPALGLDSAFRSVSASSSDNVWAVGYYNVDTPEGTLSYALSEHWDGRSWKVYNVPGATGDDLLAGSDTISGSDAWIVGSQEGKADLIAHWNGATWTRIAGPSEPHALNVLFAISGNDSTGLTATGLFIDLKNYSYKTLVENRAESATGRHQPTVSK